MVDQWLVRTTSNVIAGPYTKEQVVQLIRDGKLTVEDEVCQANHYWIFLHETGEVSRQLGIEMPRAARDGDDEDTLTETALTEPASDIPDMPDVQESEHTTAITRGSRHAPQPAAAHASASHASAPHAAPAHPNGHSQSRPASQSALSHPQPAAGADGDVMIERPSIWRGFAWLLIVVACLIVFVVLRVLHLPQRG